MKCELDAPRRRTRTEQRYDAVAGVSLDFVRLVPADGPADKADTTDPANPNPQLARQWQEKRQREAAALEAELSKINVAEAARKKEAIVTGVFMIRSKARS